MKSGTQVIDMSGLNIHRAPGADPRRLNWEAKKLMFKAQQILQARGIDPMVAREQADGLMQKAQQLMQRAESLTQFGFQ